MSKRPPPVVNMGILAQLSFTLVVAMVVPLLIGIWISRTFELGPLAIVCAMAIGMLVGALSVYRIVKQTYDQLSGDDQ